MINIPVHGSTLDSIYYSPGPLMNVYVRNVYEYLTLYSSTGPALSVCLHDLPISTEHRHREGRKGI